jgi:perosamine synthetase
MKNKPIKKQNTYKVPWTLPNFQNQDIDSMKRVLKTGWLSMGEEVEKFEKMVSSYLNITYAVAVNNGTSALDVALKCLDIGNGDEVIIPAFTYVATGNAVVYNHATPVFVDIDDTLNIDPNLIKEKITNRTKAIMNIDFGGNVSNYSELLRISKKYNIPLVVDGAQSFGCEYHKKKCCTHGLLNTTSFHAAKIITTIEGGMVFTDDKKLYEKAQILRNQGQTSRYLHSYLGNNYRMIDVIAAMGTAQMARFKKTIQQRKEKATYYKENLKNVEYPRELKQTKNSYFLFLILINKRDALNKYLNKNGIETRINYPTPVNEQPTLTKYSNEVFPKSKEAANQVLSLPLFHSITRAQQDYVIKKINSILT